MANTAHTQQALALSPSFRTRLRNALAKVAWIILLEDAQTANHAIRANYARLVLANLDGIVAQIAPWVVTRTNVFAFETTWDPPSNQIVTASGDADLEAQLAADWNHLAGVA